MELDVMFKALGDPTRLEILKLLKGRELCVCDIMEAFSQTQPAISHHLKVLKTAGLVNDTRDGKWIFYAVEEASLKELEIFISEQLTQAGVKEHCSPKSPCAFRQE